MARTMGLAATIREYTSINHLQASALFCRETLVAQNAWSGSGPTFDEEGLQAITAKATGTVFLGVAFAEASVNELLQDCAESQLLEPSRKALPPALPSQVALIAPYIERQPVLQKWRAVLKLVSGMPDPAQEANWIFLTRLRNALVHAWPENVTVASSIPEIPATAHSLEVECAKRFSKNPKIVGRAGFPEEYLAYPCAAWAFQSALSYSDHVWKLLGAPAPYDHVRPRLGMR